MTLLLQRLVQQLVLQFCIVLFCELCHSWSRFWYCLQGVPLTTTTTGSSSSSSSSSSARLTCQAGLKVVCLQQQLLLLLICHCCPWQLQRLVLQLLQHELQPLCICCQQISH
jgi:hypothetical protein